MSRWRAGCDAGICRDWIRQSAGGSTSFALVESHLHPGAASYRTVARFPLAGTDPA
jgi:hypothetical protein